MKLYPYGQLLKNISSINLRELTTNGTHDGLWVLGKNGNVGYIEELSAIRGETSAIIRWMHGGRSEWFLHLLELEVLTSKIEQSPMPETVFTPQVGLEWHPTAGEILKASPIMSVQVLDKDQRNLQGSETCAYLKALGYENDALIIRFENGCEIAVYDRNSQRCCEHRLIETADDLASLVGERFIRLDIVDVVNPEDHPSGEKEYTEQTFIKLQTNRDSVTLNAYNLSNGQYGNLEAAVCVYVPHPKLDRPNTPYIRTPEPMEHPELVYNLNTLLKRLDIHLDLIERE